MKISRETVAMKIADYLHHQITMNELVDWAESMMMEADFEDHDFETLRDIISRLGLVDLKAFGMTWEDSEDFLSRLGYHAHVIVSKNSGFVGAES